MSLASLGNGSPGAHRKSRAWFSAGHHSCRHPSQPLPHLSAATVAPDAVCLWGVHATLSSSPSHGPMPPHPSIRQMQLRNAILFRILRFHRPIWRAISVAVPGVSPVTIFLSDTCRLAFGNSRRHIRTDRITDGNHTQERQVIFSNQ